jgi:hypothetical protein
MLKTMAIELEKYKGSQQGLLVLNVDGNVLLQDI